MQNENIYRYSTDYAVLNYIIFERKSKPVNKIAKMIFMPFNVEIIKADTSFNVFKHIHLLNGYVCIKCIKYGLNNCKINN